MRDSILPIVEDPRLLQPVLRAPAPDITEKGEHVAQLGEVLPREILAGLPAAPERQQPPKRLLVREDHVDAPAILLYGAALVLDEEVVVWRDVILVELAEEFQPLNLRHSLEEILDGPGRFENKHILGFDPSRGRLEADTLCLERSLELINLRSKTLTLARWRQGLGPTAAALASGLRGRHAPWQDQKRSISHLCPQGRSQPGRRDPTTA